MEPERQRVDVIRIAAGDSASRLTQLRVEFMPLDDNDRQCGHGQQHDFGRQPKSPGERPCILLNLGHGRRGREHFDETGALENERRAGTRCGSEEDVSVGDEPHASSYAMSRSRPRCPSLSVLGA